MVEGGEQDYLLTMTWHVCYITHHSPQKCKKKEKALSCVPGLQSFPWHSLLWWNQVTLYLSCTHISHSAHYSLESQSSEPLGDHSTGPSSSSWSNLWQVRFVVWSYSTLESLLCRKQYPVQSNDSRNVLIWLLEVNVSTLSIICAAWFPLLKIKINTCSLYKVVVSDVLIQVYHVLQPDLPLRISLLSLFFLLLVSVLFSNSTPIFWTSVCEYVCII